MVKRSIPAPTNVLASFFYFKDQDLDAWPNLTFVGDSGAYSAWSVGATLTTKDLAEWAIQWRHRLKWTASLDVIGNPVKTYSNWRDMVDVYGVHAIPSIHFGTNPAELDKYARRGADLVGLGGGGMAPAKAQMRWLISVFKYAREHHPDMQFHGWGRTSTQSRMLPFYSIDSSSWTSGFRFGSFRVTDPSKGDKRIALSTNGKDAYQPEVAKLLTSYYGLSPKQVSRSNPTTHHNVVRLAALSESAIEQHFRMKHGAAKEPTWAVNTKAIRAGAGQRSLHLAEAGTTYDLLQQLAIESR